MMKNVGFVVLVAFLTSCLSQSRVRREIRSLTVSQREAVFQTWRVMKFTPQEAGELFYGENFRTWDYFVAVHLFAVVDEYGDQAHICPTFCNWHRAFILEFELSMMAINPDVTLPYWDWGKDADGGKTFEETVQSSGLFTPEYFGTYTPCTGNCTLDNHIIKDGAFAYWPILDGQEALELVSRVLNRTDVLNPYGKLLSPWNPSDIPYLTRLQNNLGFQIGSYPNSTDEEFCLSYDNYAGMDLCFNNFMRGAHVVIHTITGGSTGKDDDADWRAFIQQFDPLDQLYIITGIQLFGGSSWIGAGFGGNLQCDQSGCTCQGNIATNIDILELEIDRFGFGMTPEGRALLLQYISEWREILQTGPVPDYVDRLVCDLGKLGGFTEAGTSPNDPMFFIIHANLDRLYLHWQDRNSDLAEKSYLYPEEGFYPGCNLNDIIQENKGGWTNLFAENDNEGRPYTHKDILRIYWETKPYIYL